VTVARTLSTVALLAFGCAATAKAANDTNAGSPLYESSVGGVVVVPSLPDPFRQGFLVYSKWCTGCHAADYQPSTRDPDSAQLGLPSRVALGTYTLRQRYQGAVPAELDKRTDLTPASIKTFVRRGVNAMPAFRKTEISDADLKALSAYLTRPRNEPAPSERKSDAPLQQR
jgi:mono/diheme cytochrome c family protein